MTAVVRRFTDYAFDAFDLCRIYANVFDWNPGSCRVLEKAGYVLEGRLRNVGREGRVRAGRIPLRQGAGVSGRTGVATVGRPDGRA